MYFKKMQRIYDAKFSQDIDDVFDRWLPKYSRAAAPSSVTLLQKRPPTADAIGGRLCYRSMPQGQADSTRARSLVTAS